MDYLIINISSSFQTVIETNWITEMVNLMCQLGWVIVTYIWLNIILDVSVKVAFDEVKM